MREYQIEVAGVPESALCLKDTAVTTDGPIHDPVIEITTQCLANEDSDLQSDQFVFLENETSSLTMGVPYAPADAKGVSPKPAGGGCCRKTAFVTCRS